MTLTLLIRQDRVVTEALLYLDQIDAGFDQMRGVAVA